MRKEAGTLGVKAGEDRPREREAAGRDSRGEGKREAMPISIRIVSLHEAGSALHGILCST